MDRIIYWISTRVIGHLSHQVYRKSLWPSTLKQLLGFHLVSNLVFCERQWKTLNYKVVEQHLFSTKSRLRLTNAKNRSCTKPLCLYEQIYTKPLWLYKTFMFVISFHHCYVTKILRKERISPSGFCRYKKSVSWVTHCKCTFRLTDRELKQQKAQFLSPWTFNKLYHFSFWFIEEYQSLQENIHNLVGLFHWPKYFYMICNY